MNRLIIRVFAILLPSLLIAGISFGQKTTRQEIKAAPSKHVPSAVKPNPNHKVLRAPSGKNFYIDEVGEDHANFSLLLADDDNRTVAGTFRRAQVEVFEALMVEAKKFAETDEAVGAPGSPKTTRFMDKDEKALIVDVQKTGLESRFFITLTTLQGVLTVDTGAIRRGNKKDSPLFYAALARLQAAKSGSQSPK